TSQQLAFVAALQETNRERKEEYDAIKESEEALNNLNDSYLKEIEALENYVNRAGRSDFMSDMFDYEQEGYSKEQLSELEERLKERYAVDLNEKHANPMDVYNDTIKDLEKAKESGILTPEAELKERLEA